MIDVAKVMRAVAFAYDNGDDSGFPLSRAVKEFDLTDEENDAAWEMLYDILPKFSARYSSF